MLSILAYTTGESPLMIFAAKKQSHGREYNLRLTRLDSGKL